MNDPIEKISLLYPKTNDPIAINNLEDLQKIADDRQQRLLPLETSDILGSMGLISELLREDIRERAIQKGLGPRSEVKPRHLIAENVKKLCSRLERDQR